jgi:hypothetical protein
MICLIYRDKGKAGFRPCGARGGLLRLKMMGGESWLYMCETCYWNRLSVYPELLAFNRVDERVYKIYSERYYARKI